MHRGRGIFLLIMLKRRNNAVFFHLKLLRYCVYDLTPNICTKCYVRCRPSIRLCDGLYFIQCNGVALQTWESLWNSLPEQTGRLWRQTQQVAFPMTAEPPGFYVRYTDHPRQIGVCEILPSEDPLNPSLVCRSKQESPGGIQNAWYQNNATCRPR